ncbi:hypothetical protein BGX20_007221, partial [Mortierella sp. AD010]
PGGVNDQPPENIDLFADDDDVGATKQSQPTLTKLRKGIVKIRSSPQRIQTFARICDIVNCPKLELIKDVRIRWNSTFNMVKRAILLKDAYQSMCQNEPNLSAYSLDEDEWIYLGKLHELLCEFDSMTNAVSASVGFPTINRAMSV